MDDTQDRYAGDGAWRQWFEICSVAGCGEEKRFESGMACLNSLDGEYDVQSVNASRITIRKAGKDDSWMKVYQEQTGADVSFF